MTISKNIKKILISGAALLMFASIGAAGNLANAKHIHYHYRTHRIYRRHAKRHYRRYRKAKINKRRPRRRVRRIVRKPIRRIRRRKAHKPKLSGKLAYERKMFLTAFHEEHRNDNSEPNWMKKDGLVLINTKPQINNWKHAAEKQTIRNINRDRASVGNGPLTEDSALDQVAQKRAWQLNHIGFTHYNQNGNGIASAMNPNVSAENIAKETVSDDGHHTTNGKTVANDLNYNLFNRERPTSENPFGGGHYLNIISNNNPKIGIGAYYSKGGTYYLAEDFGI